MAKLRSKWVGNLLRFLQGSTQILDIDGDNNAVDVAALKISGTSVSATAAEINRAADVSGRLVSVTTTPLAVAEATHEGKTIALNKADGITATLPAATGSGAVYRFVVGTTASGGSYVIGVTGNDTFKGLALGLDSEGVPANAWAAGASDEVFTMDGSTQGGVVGDEVVFQDIAADVWQVQARLQQSGTEASPFSSAA
ncbi:MAG: hypothetical protein AB7I50_00565 [Vicinamibacterales bacterium]